MVFGRMNATAFELERSVRTEGASTGTYVYHTPAVRCSCTDESGQPLPTCRICGGAGVFYPNSLEKKYLVTLTGATNSREMLTGPGIIEREDMLVTFISPPVYPAAQDRVRFDRSDLKHLVVPAEPFVLERSRLAYDELPQRVARLVSVVRTNSKNGTFTTYAIGKDVNFAGNRLVWGAAQTPPVAGATMPPIGNNYSVVYHGDYDWKVKENLAPRQIGSVGMRSRALIGRIYTDQRNLERQAPIGPGGFNPGLY